jgi:molecular chaperone DnaK
MLTRNRLINQKSRILLQQRREILPLIGIGIGIFAVGTAAQYALRTIRRMNEEKNNGNNNDNNDEKDDKEPSSNRYQQTTKEFPRKALGLDIGTTFARLSSRDGQLIEMVENKEGHRATPAVLYKTFDEISVGSFAARHRWANPSKVATGYQTLLGLTTKDPQVMEYLSQIDLKDRLDETRPQEISIQIDGTTMTASSLYTYLAQDLFATVKNKYDDVSSIPVTISLPNHYQPNQIQEAFSAIQKSGFSCQSHVPDAVAAILGAHARGYLPLSQNQSLHGKYLVLDIGGRMTQISVVDMNHRTSTPTAGHTSPNSYTLLGQQTLFNVGAEYINDHLAHFISEEYYQTNKIHLLNDSFSKQRIYDTIETVKIDLSKSFSSTIDLPFITADMNGPKHLHMEISRAKLEYLIQPMFQQIHNPIIELLTKVQISNLQEVKGFLVVGGGARIPFIQKISKEIGLGIEPIFPSQPEEIISIGAAVYSDQY